MAHLSRYFLVSFGVPLPLTTKNRVETNRDQQKNASLRQWWLPTVQNQGKQKGKDTVRCKSRGLLVICQSLKVGYVCFAILQTELDWQQSDVEQKPLTLRAGVKEHKHTHPIFRRLADNQQFPAPAAHCVFFLEPSALRPVI